MAASKRRGAMINMDPSNDDPNYRYKMERVVVRSEGKNKGKVSIVTNIVSIAESIIGTMIQSEDDPRDYPSSKEMLRRTVAHLVRFLRRQIGGKVQFNKSRNAAIISGQHEAVRIQRLMFEYIEQFAMCPQCGYPELTPAVLPPVVCRSCGHSVASNERSHRSKRSKKRKEKKERIRGKEKRKKTKSSGNAKADDEHKSDGDGDGGDGVGGVLDDEERALRRRQSENEQVQRRLAEDPIFALNHYLKKHEDVSCDDVMEKIKVLSLAHSLDRRQQIKMAVHCLAQFGDDDQKVLLESIRKYSSIFVSFSLLDNDSQILMAFIEDLIVNRSVGDVLLNRSYEIWQCLYDQDIVDEEDMMRWYESGDHGFRIISDGDAKVIRERAEPFIKWLQEAEEEEDED